MPITITLDCQNRVLEASSVSVQQKFDNLKNYSSSTVKMTLVLKKIEFDKMTAVLFLFISITWTYRETFNVFLYSIKVTSLERHGF